MKSPQQMTNGELAACLAEVEAQLQQLVDARRNAPTLKTRRRELQKEMRSRCNITVDPPGTSK